MLHLSGGKYAFESHTIVNVPEEEHEVIKLIFGGATVIGFEDVAPLSDSETITDIKQVKGGIVSFGFEALVRLLVPVQPAGQD